MPGTCTLTAKLAIFVACETARNKINRKCFNGGDPGHVTAAKRARDNATQCWNFMKKVSGCVED